MDAVLLKGTFREVDDLVTHFILTCDDESAMFAIKCITMTYGEVLGKTIAFFWRLGGGEVIAGTEKITKLCRQ